MILTALMRSFENPATPLGDPDNWLVDILGGGVSDSGAMVNSETVLKYPSVYQATMLISGDVAKVPLFVYHRLEDGRTKERATGHSAYKLLRWKANEGQTALEFKQLLQASALLKGNGYAFIERAGTGAAGALLPLNASLTRPVRMKGRIWYILQLLSGETVRIPARDIFHIKGMPALSGDGLVGVSVINKGREAFGLGLAALQFASRFFSNGLTPSAFLETPQKLSPKAWDNLRASWQEMHVGLHKSHRLAILEQGLKLSPWSISPETAQMLGTREFGVREVASFFNLPPHKLGDRTRTSFNSLEQENQSYLDTALDLWFSKWEAEAWDKLLTERQKSSDSHVVEFLRAALVRADLKGRTEANVKAVKAGWKNRDEVRAEENMGPIPNGEGAKFFQPSDVRVVGENGGLSGSAGEPPNVGPQDESDAVADGDDKPGDPGSSADGPDDDGARSVDLSGCQRCLRQAVGRLAQRIGLSTRRARGSSDTDLDWPGHLVELKKYRAGAICELEPVWLVCGAQAPPAPEVVDAVLARLAGDLAPCESPWEVDQVLAANLSELTAEVLELQDVD